MVHIDFHDVTVLEVGEPSFNPGTPGQGGTAPFWVRRVRAKNRGGAWLELVLFADAPHGLAVRRPAGPGPAEPDPTEADPAGGEKAA